jgi:kelch-like protein 12
MSSVEVYHPYTRSWSEFPNLPNNLRAVGACTHDGSLYCIGGCEGMKALNTVNRLCLQEKMWNSMIPMEENRSSVAVTVYNDFIYACGGYNDVCSVKTVERFDTNLNIWFRIEGMF